MKIALYILVLFLIVNAAMSLIGSGVFLYIGDKGGAALYLIFFAAESFGAIIALAFAQEI